MKSKTALLTQVLLVLFCAVNFAHAQNSSTVVGRVIDLNDAPVTDARVEIVNRATNQKRAARTNDDGRYIFAELIPGTYRLTAERDGFKVTTKENVIVNVASRTTENFRLEVGTVTENVTVESEASLIEKDSPEVGTTIDRQFVENLPLNGRSFQTLIELTPGVVIAETSITSPGQFSVNGQRANANYFSVDGVSANVSASVSAQGFQQAAGSLPGLTILGGTNSLVSVDALQEFRVLTSSYAPEFGRSPGAQVVLKTRSGSNKFTGTLFNYFRNEALDANDFFNNAAGINPQTNEPFIPRLPLRQNNFGGVLGGPLFLPRFGTGGKPFYNGRDRSFFFVSYEGLRLVQPQLSSRLSLVPSVAARQQATGAIRDLLNAFPVPNAPSAAGDPANTERFIAGLSYPSSFDIFSLRLDQKISDKLNAFARFNNAPSTSLTQVFANQENDFKLDTVTLTGGVNYIFSPAVINELRANYSTSRGLFSFVGKAENGAVAISDSLLFPPFVNRSNSRASISLGVFVPNRPTPPNLTQGNAIGGEQKQINIVNDLTVVAGAHQLKFGADYRRLNPGLSASEIGISYNFNSVTQALTGVAPVVQIQSFAPTGDFIFSNYSFYAQDNWRATKNLTLTFGSRYEINPAPNGSRLPFTLADTDNLLTTALAPARTRQFETTYNNFAPRVGAAYQVPRLGDLVVRGGAGLFYDLGNTTTLRGYRSFPFNTVRSVPNVSFPAAASQLQPLPPNLTNTPYAAEFYVHDRNLKLPYTLQYNVALEKGLGRNQTITVSYVGARARRLLRTEFLRNQPARMNPVRPATIVLNPTLFGTGLPNTRTSSVFLTRNGSSSDYDALQAQFQRRLSQGLQVLASYTFAKSIDDVSDETDPELPIFLASAKSNRGPSVFDIRHNFTVAATYNLPAAASSGALKTITNGFAIDTIFRARSAPPVDVFASADTLNLGLRSGIRPDLVPNVPLYLDDPSAPGGKRFNPAAFAAPPFGRQGNLGRNALRGFAASQLDLAVRREFRLTERLRLQLRAEAFNLLNKANFGKPDPDLAAGTFGTVTETLGRSLGEGGSGGGFNPLYQFGGARSLQFAAKIIF